MNDKLIERLKKLLALAGNNPSEAEAQAALAKAQAVALEHGIDLALLGNVNSDEDQIHQEFISFGQRLPTVNNYVANILVKFFNVKIITTGSRSNGRGLIFVGKNDALQTAKYIYTWLSDTMVRCWHNYYHKNPGVKLDFKQSYLLGFYNGLYSKLEANKKTVESDRLTNDADKNKYALTVVNLEKKFEDFLDEHFPDRRKGIAKKIAVEGNSYSKGVEDGSNCQIAKGGIGNRTVGALT